jgi:thymidylate synthase (FAD)
MGRGLHTKVVPNLWKGGSNMNSVEILDHGFIRLDDFMGDDLSVVNSARVSFGKRSDYLIEESSGEKGLSVADEGLIGFLMRGRHGTPFEHNAFKFHVKAPIFIFREWQRHRIGSFNEMSARYMELPGEWYIPEPENVRQRIGKPGNYEYVPAVAHDATNFIEALRANCEDSYRGYKNALAAGIAPEQARLFLHVNHYSEMYWTVNARSLMNFLNLRNSGFAQWEIQQYAVAVEAMWSEIMPSTSAAFDRNGRVAP